MGHSKKRNGDREDRSQVIFYLDGIKSTYNKKFFAISVNVSDCGACIFTDRHIEKGDVFLLESRLWKNTRSARAVWAKKLGETLFEAGLSLC